MVFEARPGPATAHGHRSLAPLPPSDAAGDSRETVNTFGGVCGLGLRVKMCVWLGVSRGLDLAFLNAD